MAINKKGFLNAIQKGVEAPVGAVINKFYDIKTKNAQSKMIQNSVNSKPSNLSPEKRSISNVIAEKEGTDKALRAKISKKNPSLLK